MNNPKSLPEIAHTYHQRLGETGDDYRTVGWGSRESQQLRFEILSKDMNLSNKTILDVGCGLGDFFVYLKRHYTNIEYIGIDICESFITTARKKFNTESNCNFYACDALKADFRDVDFCFASGSFSLAFEGIEKYVHKAIPHLFNLAKEGCAFNFLSTQCDYQLSKDKHYEPEKMLKLAYTLSRKVNLLSAYELYEFTLQINKK